MYVTTM